MYWQIALTPWTDEVARLARQCAGGHPHHYTIYGQPRYETLTRAAEAVQDAVVHVGGSVERDRLRGDPPPPWA